MTQINITSPKICLGCDVSKNTITFVEEDHKQVHIIPNKPAQLKRFLKRFGPQTLAICEATGGYERKLLDVLQELNIPTHRADALKVKAFIRSFGTLGKTDAMDARALALYGRERHAKLARWSKPQHYQLHLQALVQRRHDLVQMRSAEKNRAKAPHTPDTKSIVTSIRDVIAMLNTQIKQIDRQIEDAIHRHPQLKKIITIMSQIKGIGTVTAASLCALMPELGALTRRQAAALAGMAPHPNQSGTADKYRRMKGGRPQVRKLLFMPALVAIKHEPKLKAFYENLIRKGKKPIIAVSAVMRKIIVIINARLAHKQMS